MRSTALNLAIRDDPGIETNMNQLAEIMSNNKGISFSEALDAIEDVLCGMLIYAIQEEP